jgi:cardiolipin synthase
MSDCEVVSTGDILIKAGGRGTYSVAMDLIRNTKKELQIASFSFSDSMGELLDLFETLLLNGVRITVILNSPTTVGTTIKSNLGKLSKRFSDFTTYDFVGTSGRLLHSKVIISDRARALVGSANLSWGGLRGNYEIGILVKGEQAWEISKLLDEIAVVSERFRFDG